MGDVERLARAMAIADGFDPDAKMGGGSNTFTLQAKDFNGYDIACYGPAWRSYQRQANLFLACKNAMSDTSA